MPDFRDFNGAAKSQLGLVTNWRTQLVYSRGENKAPDASLLNAVTALKLAPEWQRVIGFNELARSVYQIGTAPWNEGDLNKPTEWTDLMTIRVTEWLQSEAIMVKSTTTHEAIQRVADDRRYHPVLDYLQRVSRQWDGRERINTWLTEYCGAKDTDFTRAVARKWLVSGVARIYAPGCKADHMLLIEGKQGIGKSRAAAVLGGEWFSDDVPSLDSHAAAFAVARHWIVEMSELTAMRKSMVEVVKAFLSRTADKFRPPYGRELVNFPRQCIFVGTVNPDEGGYLTDRTGNRRFWPVSCPEELRVEELQRDRDQLWAEATLAYLARETWWMDSEDLKYAAAIEQEKRLEVDPWVEPIQRALVEMRQPEARHQAKGPGVTTGELLAALGIPIDRRTRREDLRCATILRSLGYVSCKVRRLDENGDPRYVRGFAKSSAVGPRSEDPDAIAND